MRNTIFLILITISCVVNAQLIDFNFGLSTDNQELIRKSMEKSLIVMNSSYQLKDTVTNEYYGRHGRDEFGRTYSIGIKVKGGYYLSDKAVHPWMYDNNFNRYRETYLPVFYKGYYKELQDSTLTEIGKRSEYLQTEIYPQQFYFRNDSALFNGKGFEPECQIGKKDGWLVWLVADKPITESDSITSTSYIIYRKTLEIKEGYQEYNIDAPSTDKTIWGGIYVVPESTDIGQITFRLSGVLVEKEGKWAVLTAVSQNSNECVIINDENEGNNALTPIRKEETKNKKNKKNRK